MRVLLIFDIGKTNKKALLFDEAYEVVWKNSVVIPFIKDEDGYLCDDLAAITTWMEQQLNAVRKQNDFTLAGINCTAYGATLVYLDHTLQPMLPLYDYGKPYPEKISDTFFEKYGRETWSLETASPVLYSLNSGLQLYRMKEERPQLYANVKCCLHLPDYFSYFLSGALYAELTSIGCHTGLWNFREKKYHRWVSAERLNEVLPPIISDHATYFNKNKHETCLVGTALHDSSAALIPYTNSIRESFVLLSTGTWSITLNPFNHSPLTKEQLQADCLCYLSPQGNPVKAARLHAGNYHDVHAQRISEHFHIRPEGLTQLKYDEQKRLTKSISAGRNSFASEEMNSFTSYEIAYYSLMQDIIAQQVASTSLVLQKDTRKIFVDGGFGKNEIFMQLLAGSFPEKEVFAAVVGEATALGGALHMHKSWNKNPVPEKLLSLRRYLPANVIV
ncbi:MAG TPA: FGGY family carbohydrate kinase [Flavitalea sp.]|nr:FGGY family carbohydrate kinase [Flavitalea sp.]